MRRRQAARIGLAWLYTNLNLLNGALTGRIIFTAIPQGELDRPLPKPGIHPSATAGVPSTDHRATGNAGRSRPHGLDAASRQAAKRDGRELK
jgi:hypothetical protein